MARLDTAPALRIAAPANTMTAAVEAWLANLAARGKKPGTLRTYRCLLEASSPVLGWRTTSDINAESLSLWMAAKREAGEWKGVTLNHNLSAFKSLTRFLTKTNWLTTDPLASIDRAEDDGGDGARAATTDEARRLIRFAWERARLDRRARGTRALVWQCCFTMGLRAGEPEKLRWAHVLLDEEVPLVRWAKEINKNRKLQEVALPPETAALLRVHRDTVPHEPNDLVFPVVPPRHTFNHDRDEAQILVKDSRGRTFSSHSARKWLSTTLTTEGVHPRVIDRLMRHSGGVEQRYADLSLSEQLAGMQRLPQLWPENIESWMRKSVDLLTSSAESGNGTSMTQTTPNSASPPRFAASLSSTCQLDGSARRRGDTEFGTKVQHDNGQNRSQRLGDDSGCDVAAMLRAMANLIERAGPNRGSANDHPT